MEAKLFLLTCSLPLQPLLPTCNMRLSRFKTTSPSKTVLRRCMNQEEQLLEGMPKEYYDDEWQARQREKTKELHRRRREEEEEEERKVEEYREIGMRLKGYPQEDVVRARKLVSSFIRAEEEVEEKIEEAAERGELTELVLMVIWNRLDLARRDVSGLLDEKDAIRSLDLLYRRVEEASPAMRLLNDLLNMHDGFDNEGWLKECKKRMVETFPREDPFSILVPAGFDIDKHHGPLSLPAEADDVLLRVDFIREVDALLQEVRSEQNEAQTPDELDPESVAVKLKEHERKRTIRQVETLLDLAINLQW
ncbi:protein PALE CRESS, chloroplastic isoform X3 [Gossypium hirsutum]|uniref:Protein PALE CRESS, chloroplastic isoform X3 n=1 Tax=Gossypium hirsutum TaxID=3635 RepID=A0ABM3ALP9_GOSHI|nr:protein PALE CRESS, chloroplastic-like isoform X3 [Gossypium hirsutum]